MQEVKRPKKPLVYFYVAMILAILVFNCLVAPYLARKAIEDVDYISFSSGVIAISHHHLNSYNNQWLLLPACRTSPGIPVLQ